MSQTVVAVKASQQLAKFETVREIRPDSVKRTTISNNLVQLEFKLFDNQNIEIVYNPSRNMFNATKLFTSVGANPKALKEFLKAPQNLQYIDEISKLLTGNVHFSYNGETLWDEAKQLKSELRETLLTNKSNMRKSMLVHTKDNIFEIVENGANIEKGTWMNYQMLPEVLRLASNKFRFLANHYESMLLPLLSNQGTSFESHVNHAQSLFEKNRLKELSLLQRPCDKGAASEQYVIEVLQNAFPEDEIRHVGHQKHTCDIELVKSHILVEVKNKKKDSHEDKERFLTDIMEHSETINMGIYINLQNDNLETHAEFNPLRFYVNRDDFTQSFINFIKATNEHINDVITCSREVNRQLRSCVVIKTINEASIDYLSTTVKNILRGMVARLKMDPEFGKVASLMDVRFPEKINRDIERSKNIERAQQLLHNFVAINREKFNDGYPVKQARNDINNYFTSKGLNYGKQNIIELCPLYLTQHRDESKPGNINVYNIINGMETDFLELPEESEQPEQVDENTANVEDKTDTNKPACTKPSPPPIEEIGAEFFKISDIHEKLSKEPGYVSTQVAARFRGLIIREYLPNYDINNPNTYTSEFQKLAYNYCIQVQRKTTRYYIFRDTPAAQLILKDFDVWNNELTIDN